MDFGDGILIKNKRNTSIALNDTVIIPKYNHRKISSNSCKSANKLNSLGFVCSKRLYFYIYIFLDGRDDV